MFIRKWLILGLANSSEPETPGNSLEGYAGPGMEIVSAQIAHLLSEPRVPKINVNLWQQRLETVDLSSFIQSEQEIFALHPIIEVDTTGVYQVTSPGGGLVLPGMSHPLILVYRQYCRYPGRPLNMAGVDYWFLDHLKDSGLVPVVYDISDPIFGVDLKDKFLSLKKANMFGKILVRSCPDTDATPEIRYIIMERIMGESIGSIVDKSDPFEWTYPINKVMEFGIHMTRTLQALHRHNVIHGDAHAGNFILLEGGGVKLVDFERARLYHPADYQGDTCDDPAVIAYMKGRPVKTGKYHSPWESRQCKISFRDDIHRMLVSMAMMIHGRSYTLYFSSLSQQVSVSTLETMGLNLLYFLAGVWRFHRERGHIFEVRGFDSLASKAGMEYNVASFPAKTYFSLRSQIADQGTLDSVRDLLRPLEKSVVGMKITDQPDYDRLVNTFSAVAQLTQHL